MELILILTLLIGAVIIFVFLNAISDFNLTGVQGFDGNVYKVMSIRPGDSKKKAADLLAEINRRLNVLVRDDPELSVRYDSSILRESTTEAYTLGKGHKIYLDLNPEDDPSDNFYPIDLLMFVMIHELAHIYNPNDSHNATFQNHNNRLLERAQSLGIYSPIHGTFTYSGQTFSL